MRKSLSYSVISLLLIVVVGWSFGCRDDVVVPIPPSLIGDYTGSYAMMQISGVDTLVDTTQLVDFRFTDKTYNMKILPPAEELRFFCDCAGDYTLENGVQFIETDGNLTNKVCTPANNPTGSFGLDRSTLPDTMLIKQDLTDGGVRRIKTLKLVKDTP